MRPFPLAVLVAAGLSLSAPASATDGFDTCAGFIDALPAVISTPGTWCLRKNLTTALTSGRGISLESNDVRLDCHGFRVSGVTGGPSATGGVVATDVDRVEVRNCTVRGFGHGIVANGNDVLIRGNTVEQSDAGISIDDPDFHFGVPTEVRDNLVVDSGTFGIRTFGDVLISGNTVDGVEGGDIYAAHGIQSFGGDTIIVVEHNLVRNIGTPSIHATGIFVDSDWPTTIRHNTVIAMPGVYSLSGIYCYFGSANDNVVSGWSTGIQQCATDDNVIID